MLNFFVTSLSYLLIETAKREILLEISEVDVPPHACEFYDDFIRRLPGINCIPCPNRGVNFHSTVSLNVFMGSFMFVGQRFDPN